jgi:hypothetical protein
MAIGGSQLEVRVLCYCRNPAKDTIKNIFLDGIGEAPNSHRRSSSNGLQVCYSAWPLHLAPGLAACLPPTLV